MTTERMCGNLNKAPIGQVADRAARLVLEYASARAVTMDPDGRVWVEPVEHAAEADMVGVYTRSLGILELNRRIIADLQHEAQARSFRPTPAKRRVVGRPRATAGRAA